MRLEHRLGPLDREIERKEASLFAPPDAEIEALKTSCEEAAPGLADAAGDAVSVLLGAEVRDGAHGAMSLYAAHPVRVARMFVEGVSEPRSASVRTAVVHNLMEVSDAGEDHLLALGLEPEVVEGVAVLTIDRDRETDRAYLANYYGAIEGHSSDLALIKTFDRLDNVLGLRPFAGDFVWGGYLDLTLEFVVPMAGRVHEQVGEYLANAVGRIRELGHDHELAANYQRHRERVAR